MCSDARIKKEVVKTCIPAEIRDPASVPKWYEKRMQKVTPNMRDIPTDD